MRVKLVNEDGEHLPFKGGFVLVPEDRLVLFEKIATAARSLLSRHEDVVRDASQLGRVEPALRALGEKVSELERVWEIPK
jgi:hypothetical protein